MSKLKNFYKKNSFLLKVLISYFIVSSFLLSTFSLLLVRTYTQKSIEEIKETTQNMVNQSSNTLDLLITTTFGYLYDLYANDASIISALCNTTFDEFEKIDIINKLNRILNTHRFLHSVYIYNKAADIVFSTNPSGNAMVTTVTDFYDKGAIDVIKNITRYKGLFIPRRADFKIDNAVIKENLVSLVLHMAKPDEEPVSAFIVNFKQTDFQKTITNGKLGSQFQTFIVDNSGIIISHTEPSMINKNVIKLSYIKKILSSSQKEGSFIEQTNDGKYFVSYAKANTLGWTIVGIGEYNKLLLQSMRMRRSITIMTFIFNLLAVFIVLLFTRNIYFPLYNLIKEIRNKNKDQISEMNEYELLNWTFHNLLENVKELKTNVHKFLPAKKKEIIFQLLNNEIPEEMELASIFEKYNIQLNNPYYVVVVFKLDHFHNLCITNKATDISLFKFAVLNIASEIIQREFSNEGIENGLDHISLIVGLKSKNINEAKESLTSLIKEIQKYVYKYFEISTTASIGTVVEKIQQVNNSYKSALTASNYRLLYGTSSIIYFDDIQDNLRTVQDYPYEQEIQISKSIKARNLKKSEEYIDEFFDVVKNSNPDEAFTYIMQLCIVMLRSQRNQDNETGNFEIDFKTFYNEMSKYETLDEVKAYVKELCKRIIDAQIMEVMNKKQSIAAEIKEFIDKNYQNAELTIYDIADYVELSPNYARTIFKEVYGISPTDYLIEARINKAKDLLKTTDMSAKKISEMIGFSDSRYFYVIFKKYTGKTADEFRREIS